MKIMHGYYNKEAEIISRPWWTSHSFTEYGRVCVARTDVVLDGERYMIGLTEEDVKTITESNEYVNLPVSNTDITLNRRPRTNKTSRPVSDEERQAAYDKLLNEGY